MSQKDSPEPTKKPEDVLKRMLNTPPPKKEKAKPKEKKPAK